MIASLADSLIVVDEQAERIADLERQLAEARLDVDYWYKMQRMAHLQLAEARKDTERLYWLETMSWEGQEMAFHGTGITRKSIDRERLMRQFAENMSKVEYGRAGE